MYVVSDLMAKYNSVSFARGGVADNDVGLWVASFFFSPRVFFSSFFLYYPEKEKGKRKKKLTI